jgi:hypothetical protein
MSAEDVIREALTPFLKSNKRREKAAESIAENLREAGLLLDYAPETVEVVGSRVAIETTTVGGLTVSLDAAGNAVRVTSPYGFEVIE